MQMSNYKGMYDSNTNEVLRVSAKKGMISKKLITQDGKYLYKVNFF